jgi:hypothetical protein
MNRELRKEIVGCLRVTGSGDANLSALRKFSPRDWETSLEWLHVSGIALTFWNGLQNLGAEDVVPAPVRSGLAANLSGHRARIAAMAREFDSLNRQFERAGIAYAVWKGFALIPEFSPDAYLRPTYDYDYLVSAETHALAERLLLDAGYVRKHHEVATHHLTFALPAQNSDSWTMPESLYAATLPRKVELHERLWFNQAFNIPLQIPERVLDRKVRRTWQGVRFYSLGQEDALLFQVLHAFQHILHNWCRLGWLWEIAHFLKRRSEDASFWTRFYAHLDGNEKLSEIVAMVFRLAAALFHAPLPASAKEGVGGAMRGQVSLWVDQYGLDSALDNFSENKYALFLYREFVRDKATWRKIQRDRLLPLHRPNRVRVAGIASRSNPLPTIWKQGWYVMQRLAHHSVGGAAYLWEFARWQRLRRLHANRVLSSS